MKKKLTKRENKLRGSFLEILYRVHRTGSCYRADTTDKLLSGDNPIFFNTVLSVIRVNALKTFKTILKLVNMILSNTFK